MIEALTAGETMTDPTEGVMIGLTEGMTVDTTIETRIDLISDHQIEIMDARTETEVGALVEETGTMTVIDNLGQGMAIVTIGGIEMKIIGAETGDDISGAH